MKKRLTGILIDRSVADYPLTRMIIRESAEYPIRFAEHSDVVALLHGTDNHQDSIAVMKHELVVTRNTGSFFKYMGVDPGVADDHRKDSWRLEVFQGCPADCRYCFCQQYLKSHRPVVYANVEDINKETSPGRSRLVTGDIADSLALGRISVLVHEHVARWLPEARFELRSKFKLPDNWNRLDATRFRFDWSLSPESIRRTQEPGTDPVDQRIDSAAMACKAGFKVGIRMDPLQPERIDAEQYEILIARLRNALPEGCPDSFVIGSYKMTPDLLDLIRRRFPGNPLPGYEWTRCPDGKLRPFRTQRIASYRDVKMLLECNFPGIPIVFSMEFAYVLNLLS